MEAVQIAGGAIVEEVRRQFKEFPGILKGKTKPYCNLTVGHK